MNYEHPTVSKPNTVYKLLSCDQSSKVRFGHEVRDSENDLVLRASQHHGPSHLHIHLRVLCGLWLWARLGSRHNNIRHQVFQVLRQSINMIVGLYEGTSLLFLRDEWAWTMVSKMWIRDSCFTQVYFAVDIYDSPKMLGPSHDRCNVSVFFVGKSDIQIQNKWVRDVLR